MTFDLNDLLGRTSGQGGFSGGLGDVFGGLFGARGGTQARGPKRGADVEADVTLGFADAVRGATVPLRLTTTGGCETCRGLGSAPGTSPKTCSACGGAGVTTRNQGGFALSEPCKACRGKGRVVETPCSTCQGTGTTAHDRTLTVRIPAGVADGQKVRLSGRGAPGERGGPAGDLLVNVHVTPHRLFDRRDDHLTVTVPITFAEAALGAKVVVPTLEAPVTLKIPAGTSSGRTFRVKGRGIARKNGVTGDLLVTVEVAVPQKLTAEAKKALEAFAAAAPEDPRAHLVEATR